MGHTTHGLGCGLGSHLCAWMIHVNHFTQSLLGQSFLVLLLSCMCFTLQLSEPACCSMNTVSLSPYTLFLLTWVWNT